MLHQAKYLIPLILSASTGVAAAEFGSEIRSELQITDRGPHQQRIEYQSRRVTERGEELMQTNSYVQIQTGLNRWDEINNDYVPANAAIEMVNGYGVIKNAQRFSQKTPMIRMA